MAIHLDVSQLIEEVKKFDENKFFPDRKPNLHRFSFSLLGNNQVLFMLRPRVLATTLDAQIAIYNEQLHVPGQLRISIGLMVRAKTIRQSLSFAMLTSTVLN